MSGIPFSIDDLKLAIGQALDEHVQTPWFDTKRAAEYIGCTPKTLKTWRSTGGGPRYHIIHKKLVRYHVDDLNEFVRTEGTR